MSWEQILGFFTMWPSPNVTIVLWAKCGIPLWQTIAYVTLLTSFSLGLTFFGTGWLEKWTIKRGWIQESTIEKWRMRFQKGNNNHAMNGFEKKMNGRFRRWLIPQKNWKILACGFIPFIPLIPTVVVIVTRLLRIRNGFLVLILGNAVRTAIVCYAIYQGVRSLT